MKIDIERLLCSLIECNTKPNHKYNWLADDIITSLRDQGLIYKDSQIIPELKESEDERIRKALIRYFTLSDEHAYNEACGVSYRDIIAWLERRGEQKPVVAPKFRVGDTVKAKTMEYFMFTIKDVTDKQYVDTNGGKYDIEGQDYLELVDHKPEWSKKDERMVTRIVESLSAYANKLRYEGFRLNSEVLYEQINWLKSLRPQSQWKPSESEISILKDIILGKCNPQDYQATLLNILERLKAIGGE